MRWFGASFGEPQSLEHWRDTLSTFDEKTPEVTTVPVGSHPRNVSPYGVADLVGNCWEWTDTNFFTRDRMKPMISGRPRTEWATAEETSVVIRGGAWTSMREQVTTYFRGKDLFTDRHNEIGFQRSDPVSSTQRVPRFRYDGTVTEEQRAFYEQYGFVIYTGVFDAQDVEVIQRDAERLERDTLDGKVPAEHRDRVIKPSYDEKGRATLHRLPYFTLHSADTRELIERRKLDALGPGLLGRPDVAVRGRHRRSRVADETGQAKLVQRVGLAPGLSARPPADPAGERGHLPRRRHHRNGCLMLVPGSHRYPPRRLETLRLPLEAEAGDVICHTYNILHRSGPVLDDTSRATLYVYYSAGQKPSAGTEYSHRAGEDFAKMITGAEADAR